MTGHTIEFKGKKLHYYTSGNRQNPTVLFLHGYLEGGLIWEEFVENFKKEYFIICPDIPGHGKSEIYSKVHDMNSLAERMVYILEAERKHKIHLVGHSMGGYLALAIRKHYSEKLLSCTLFHSTCFSDSEEKKKNRDREIDLILRGKKDLIINTNIPNAFATENLESPASEVEKAKKTGLENTDQGIISLLEGMKEREDHSLLMQETKIPYLFIAGKKDNYITSEVAVKVSLSGTKVETVYLENSGHMGFMEEPGKSCQVLDDFFKKTSPF